MHTKVQSSFAWLKFRVGGLVHIVIARKFSFYGSLTILDSGKDIKILLFRFVLVLVLSTVPIFLLGLKRLGDGIEAILVASPCSFCLTYHEKLY